MLGLVLPGARALSSQHVEEHVNRTTDEEEAGEEDGEEREEGQQHGDVDSPVRWREMPRVDANTGVAGILGARGVSCSAGLRSALLE